MRTALSQYHALRATRMWLLQDIHLAVNIKTQPVEKEKLPVSAYVSTILGFFVVSKYLFCRVVVGCEMIVNMLYLL